VVGILRGAAVAAIGAMLLAGCSNPKSTVIPAESAKWDTIAPSLQKLKDEDRRLAAAYMLRMSLGGAFGANAGISPGTTIGQAIENQKKFEADQKVAEAQAAALRAKVLAERQAAVAKISNAVQVVLANKTVIPENIYAGRYSASIGIQIAIQNKSAKAITGVKGVFDFRDQFGSPIMTLKLSMDEDVPAGGQRLISGYGMDINEFRDDHNKLANTEFSKMKATFTPEAVVFADGSTLAAPELPEGP
jgi:hypothetical protein